ncbi:hypothetical protein [uncultured Brachyspira sp.]|uniref:hypothetical protein n=1 Tax=uncultured Brachyspira sp. TaxID=221953 RepID=UPI00259BCD72|nr:hypothetical protein [uncultured Brachyspira sp.]
MTNSKKIKRNIGASRRLAPFGHVRSITFTIMLLTVALIFGCRKSGGGGDPTPQNPNKSIGRLLIISSDGKTNINSIPLSFSYANATVSDFQSTSANLLLTKDNFIIENGTLKIGNDFDLSTLEAGKENEATLTFKLTPSSATPITKDTDTATIYIGKMQTNISVETLKKLKFDVSDTVKGQDSFDGDKLVQTTKHKSILFKNTDFKADASDDSKFTLDNVNTGDDGNQLKMSEFSTILSNSFNSNKDISTYNNNAGFEITSSTEGTKATFVIKFKPFNSFYKEHSITFEQKKGAWIE